MSDSGESVVSVIDSTEEVLNGEHATVSDLVEGLGHASMSAVLLVPAAAVVSPLSGIPLFSSVCGGLIFLVSGQMLFGRSHLWLPAWIGRRRIDMPRANQVLDRARSVARWLDRHRKTRLRLLLRQPFITLPRAICALCGAMMPVFELVPFSSSILATVVSINAVAMLTRDGLLLLIGFLALAAGGTGLALYLA